MARKPYVRTKERHRDLPEGDAEFEAACFLADVIDGTVRASDVVEVRDGRGRFVRFDYEEIPEQAAAPVVERR